MEERKKERRGWGTKKMGLRAHKQDISWDADSFPSGAPGVISFGEDEGGKQEGEGEKARKEHEKKRRKK